MGLSVVQMASPVASHSCTVYLYAAGYLRTVVKRSEIHGT